MTDPANSESFLLASIKQAQDALDADLDSTECWWAFVESHGSGLQLCRPAPTCQSYMELLSEKAQHEPRRWLELRQLALRRLLHIQPRVHSALRDLTAAVGLVATE